MISSSDRIQQIRKHLQTYKGADRYTFLAYAFLRGVPYRNVEATTRDPLTVSQLETLVLSEVLGVGLFDDMKARRETPEYRELMAWVEVPEEVGRFQRRQYARHAQRERRAAHTAAMRAKWGRS